MRGGDGLIHQLRYTLAVGGGNGNHRNAQRLAHLLHVDGAAVGAHLVHHVQCQHHGHLQFQQLQRQVQVALDVGGVHNVDDAVGLLIDDEIARDDFLLRIGTQGINAGQIDYRAATLPANLAHFLIDRYAGKIAYMLVRTG